MKKNKLIILLVILGSVCLYANTPRMGNWRWRADDGNEQNATFLTEENHELIITKIENIRLRLEIYDSEGNFINGFTDSYSLRYSTDLTNWIEITNESSVNAFALSLSNNFNDLEITTNDLLTNTNSRTHGNGKMIESSSLFSFEHSNFEDHCIEFEWCLTPTDHVVQEQRYYFRVVDGDQLGDVPDDFLVPNISPTLKIGSSLPVELAAFTATTLENKVSLNWETATEVNNYGFEIEKLSSTPLRTNDIKVTNSNTIISSGAEVWEVIGFVNGNGNSNSPKLYSYSDNNPTSGKLKYRLKQIDIDGRYEYSKEIEVNISIPSDFSLSQNYPNPFNPSTIIGYSIGQPQKINLTVYNSLGQEVVQLVNEYKEVGNYDVIFNASKLSSGIYYYRLKTSYCTKIKKMMLLK